MYLEFDGHTPVLALTCIFQFHRGEYTVREVKEQLQKEGLLIRQVEN